MTTYWVEFQYNMDEGSEGVSGSPVQFLGYTARDLPVNFFGSAIEPGAYYDTNWMLTSLPYSFATQGNWELGPNGYTFVFSGDIYFNYTISIENSYIVGTQPDPVTLVGPTSTASATDMEGAGPNQPQQVTVQWTDWAWAQITVPGGGPLFTTGADTVDFNNLTSDQQAAIAAGSETTNGMGGSDNVTLNSTYSTFSTGSNLGDKPTVSAGNGNYNITLGAGSDTVGIDGNGNSTVTAGSGIATINISGAGSNEIVAGTGSINLSLTGSGTTVFKGNLNGSVSASDGEALVVSGAVFGSGAIDTGAKLLGAAIGSGGQFNVSSGGIASGTIVSSGGTFLVWNGGVASGTQLYAHGPTAAGEAILSGGKSYNETIFAGGGESVRDGGISFDAVVSSGGTLNVGLPSISGGIASHTMVSGGGRVNVMSGGTTVSAVLIGSGTSRYAIEAVSNGGTASATSILNTGELVVSSGGVASDTTVSSTLFGTGLNGGLFVQSGGSSINAQINNSGLEVVFSGGTDSNTTVDSGGFLTVSSGGMASDTEVNGGGVLTVYVSGASLSAALLGSGTTNSAREILSGGTATGTTVTDTGKLVVLAGGVASGTIVNSTHFGTGSNGGLFVSSGGSATNAQINSGGVEVVFSGGTDSNTTVDSGGNLTVSSGGVASDTKVNGGSVLVVVSGGSSLSAAVLGSGTANSALEVLSGGVASDTSVTDTGKLLILAGGVASDTVVNSTLLGSGSNGGLFVSSGGSATDAQINSGGVEVVFSGGTDSSATVDSGGILMVSSGGVASDTEINGGSFVSVFDGGQSADVQVNSGGAEIVASGGKDYRATIVGGTQYVYGSAVSAILQQLDTVIRNEQIVESGGLASSTTIFGVHETVSSGGIDISAYASGGEQDVYGSANVAIIRDGGTQVVYSGGVTSLTSLSGLNSPIGIAKEIVSGGTAFDTSVGTNGELDVLGVGSDAGHAKGTASSTWLDSGGLEHVSSGAADFATTINGGSVETVYGDATTSSASVFGNDRAVGKLVLDGGISFSAAVFSGGELDVSNDLVAAGDSLAPFTALHGSALYTDVEGGGILHIFQGGVAFDTTLSGGGKLILEAGAVASGAITFEATGNELDILGTNMPTALLNGFSSGNSIDLESVDLVSGGHAELLAGNVLRVTEGASHYDLALGPTENFSDFKFKTIDDGSNHVLIVESIACYCRGVSIESANGEVPVETLAIGDLVKTRRGELRPIKWIGKRSYGGRFIMGRRDILPICIRAGALDDDVPCRDLRISPHHAMYLEGVLVEAKDLVNGVSIMQAEQVDEVEYFHIELDTHDVIFAEGAPSETFVDDDSRGMFHNAHEYREMYPEEVRRPTRYCAPRLDFGYEVETIRERLAHRAGIVSTNSRPGGLRGFVDEVSKSLVRGWAQNIDHPEAPVCLDIFADGGLVGQTLANRYREDLCKARIGTGRHAFEYHLPNDAGFRLKSIEVRRSFDGARLAISESRSSRRRVW